MEKIGSVLTENGKKVLTDAVRVLPRIQNIYEIKSKLHDSMNTEIYITGESLVVDIGCHSYGTAEIKFCPMCGRNLKEGADNDT